MKIWLIIYLILMVSHIVQSEERLVVNTTCLELAKPSDQHLRLTCSQYDYHCLLDESYTQEFEVCREWKWIPKGKCAYFNTYGSGNIDERECKAGINLTCSKSNQFESTTNTQFPACYVKKDISTALPTAISSVQDTSNGILDGGTATSHLTSKAWIIFGITFAILSIFVILFISRRLCEKANDEESQNSTVKKSNDAKPERENNSPQKEKTTDENNSVPGLLVTDKQNDDSDSEICEMTRSSPRVSDNEEGSDEGTSYPCHGFVQSHYTQIATEDKEDSFKVFADTFESLKKRENAKDEKYCLELYSLLFEKGLELSRNVIGSVIKQTIEKSNKKLSGDETMENELEKGLPDGLLHLAKEGDKSFHAVYRFLQINLDEKHNPKSGWGNPVRDTDFGIGDDVERLNRIQNIGREIQKQAEVSVESYFKLLDIMINALTRLDPGADFTEDLRTIRNKRKNIQMVTMPDKSSCTDTTTLL